MKRKLSLLISALACAALAITLAPTTPTASAGANGGHHGHHYDDPEAQKWYDFAHEKGTEIHHLYLSSRAIVEAKAYVAACRIDYYCRIPCRNDAEERRYERRRKEIARKARFAIGKCIWEAHMELEACYTDARQQLEDAGYEYFLPYLYNPYRFVERDLVRGHRNANHFLACAANCTLDSPDPF